jgi:putative oxidoreductase
MLITGLRLFSGAGGDFTAGGRPSRDSKAVHMSTVSISLALAIRVVLVLLFLPFSALDKVLDFRSAVAQAQEAVPNKAAATALILVGLFVEVFMSAGVVSGIADRACAFVLAGYCAVTALVWKQFWRPGDFWSSSDGKARALFWDFWKNLALAAGFLLIVFGTNASSIAQFLAHPTIQSHPYRLTQEHVRP